MSDGASTIASVLAGVLLVALALRDILHQLFHPGGSGSLARGTMRILWTVLRPSSGRPHAGGLAGPLILVAILVLWASMLTVGWALIYWPFLPEAFRFASPLEPAFQHGLDDALYLSLVSLGTLGFGDITPIDPWLRMASAVQGLIGFALLTAGVSWILMLYPVLTRRRAFASRVLALTASGVPSLGERDVGETARLLDDLTAELTMLRADLMLSPISYYFRETDPGVALPRALPRLADAARAVGADRASGGSARHAAATLDRALDDFAALVGREHLHLHDAPTDAVFVAFARDHGRTIA